MKTDKIKRPPIDSVLASSAAVYSRTYSKRCRTCGAITWEANPECGAFQIRLEKLGLKYVCSEKLNPGEFTAGTCLTDGVMAGYYVTFRLPSNYTHHLIVVNRGGRK